MRPILLYDRCVLFHGDAAKLGDVLEPNSIDVIMTRPVPDDRQRVGD